MYISNVQTCKCTNGWNREKEKRWETERVGSRGTYNATLQQPLMFSNVFKKYNWYGKQGEKMKSYKVHN